MGSHRVGHDWSDLAAAAAAAAVCIWQFQSPNLSVTFPFPTDNHKLVFYICDSICFVNKFICTIFLGSTYTWYHMIFVFLWLTVTHYDNLYIHPHCCRWHYFVLFYDLGILSNHDWKFPHPHLCVVCSFTITSLRVAIWEVLKSVPFCFQFVRQLDQKDKLIWVWSNTLNKPFLKQKPSGPNF